MISAREAREASEARQIVLLEEITKRHLKEIDALVKRKCFEGCVSATYTVRGEYHKSIKDALVKLGYKVDCSQDDDDDYIIIKW